MSVSEHERALAEAVAAGALAGAMAAHRDALAGRREDVMCGDELLTASEAALLAEAAVADPERLGEQLLAAGPRVAMMVETFELAGGSRHNDVGCS